MGQILHGSATTTEAVRRAVQHIQASLRQLAKRYGINQKTVAKWKKRSSVTDLPTGPKEPKSTVLSREDEAIIVAFRRHTLLPLDNCLYVAIDRTSKFAFVEVVRKTGRTSASAFLTTLVEAVPHKIHTVLTDNGIQFTFPLRYADGPTARYMTHMFDMRCRENGIEHRLTTVKRPWTNGQVERMNRIIKEATVKRFHYDDHRQFETHLADFVAAYNFGRRLKTLRGLTPYEFICKCWTSEPQRFRLNPFHQMPGLNT